MLLWKVWNQLCYKMAHQLAFASKALAQTETKATIAEGETICNCINIWEIPLLPLEYRRNQGGGKFIKLITNSWSKSTWKKTMMSLRKTAQFTLETSGFWLHFEIQARKTNCTGRCCTRLSTQQALDERKGVKIRYLVNVTIKTK